MIYLIYLSWFFVLSMAILALTPIAVIIVVIALIVERFQND